MADDWLDLQQMPRLREVRMSVDKTKYPRIYELPLEPLQKGDRVIHIEGEWFQGTVQAFFILKEDQVKANRRLEAGTKMALVEWDEEHFKKVMTRERASMLYKRYRKKVEGLILQRGTGIAGFYGKWVSVNQLRKI